MITVRFPNGFSVQYNDMTHVSWGGNGSGYLHNNSTAGWSVRVPPDCLIEFIQPCRTYSAPSDVTSERLWELTRQVELLKKTVARRLK